MKPTVRHARAHDASPTEHLSPVAVESVPTGVALTSTPVQTPEVTLPVRQSPTVPQAPGTFSATTVPVAVPPQARGALFKGLVRDTFQRWQQAWPSSVQPKAGGTIDLAIAPQDKDSSQPKRRARRSPCPSASAIAALALSPTPPVRKKAPQALA